jgi:GT2 family glycosyltransferase
MTAIVRYEFGDEPRPVVESPWGANMAYRRDAFTRYGGFDPRFGPMGQTLMRGEDMPFARRLVTAGRLECVSLLGKMVEAYQQRARTERWGDCSRRLR